MFEYAEASGGPAFPSTSVSSRWSALTEPAATQRRNCLPNFVPALPSFERQTDAGSALLRALAVCTAAGEICRTSFLRSSARHRAFADAAVVNSQPCKLNGNEPRSANAEPLGSGLRSAHPSRNACQRTRVSSTSVSRGVQSLIMFFFFFFFFLRDDPSKETEGILFAPVDSCSFQKGLRYPRVI